MSISGTLEGIDLREERHVEEKKKKKVSKTLGFVVMPVILANTRMRVILTCVDNRLMVVSLSIFT